MTDPCCMVAAHGQACTCRRQPRWPDHMDPQIEEMEDLMNAWFEHEVEGED